MKKILTYSALALAVAACTAQAADKPVEGTNYDYSRLRAEKLGRGLVAVRSAGDTVAVGWRFLSADADDAGFDLYRDGVKLNAEPIVETTMFYDVLPGTAGAKYEVMLTGQTEALDAYVLPENAPKGGISIPLDIPAPGVTPEGDAYTYSANDASIGDVDGDGRYEIILKWDPSNAHDNAHDGYTGSQIFDCYTLDGQKLWRIDLGKNIRSGAHYTQFMVYDFDGDGKAEIIMKTADGTVDGQGNVIGDANADWVNPGEVGAPRGGDFPPGDPRGLGRPGDPLRNQGRILTGPEYLTVFEGATGKALQTVDYIPERGDLEDWGDARANRSDRFLAGVAFLDGERPSAVMCRGYYTRAVLTAWDWDGKELKTKWIFDSNDPVYTGYIGQGNHNLRVADVDGDGCDEIIYGQCAIDHDGRGLYSTRMDHGDALHLTAFYPGCDSLQVWGCHENKKDGSSFRDAATGRVIFQVPNRRDVGRAMAADIDPTNWGLEMWASDPHSRSGSDGAGGIRNVKGEVINPDQSSLSINFAAWWDGDLLRELLDKNLITKYNWETGRCDTLQVFEGYTSNNGSKATPCLSGDILGDWREEVILRAADNSELRIFVSDLPTPYRFHTFLEDVPYRMGIAAQNTAYNVPPQVGFYFGSDFEPGTKVRGTIIK